MPALSDLSVARTSCKYMSALLDSNQGPSRYKLDALTN